ncbi:MAG: hypothetical protein ACKV0T_27560, partial [Planctomycetales bacterium]
RSQRCKFLLFEVESEEFRPIERGGGSARFQPRDPPFDLPPDDRTPAECVELDLQFEDALGVAAWRGVVLADDEMSQLEISARLLDIADGIGDFGLRARD